ncbi:hypothetical protein Ahia01_001024500 [Argonauta hians]
MSKVAVKRPAQYRLTFSEDDNCRYPRLDPSFSKQKDTNTARIYEHESLHDYKMNVEASTFEQLELQLKEEARLFKEKWNYDLTDQKSLPGNYCWETKSAKSFPVSYAKSCFYSYYCAQPFSLNAVKSVEIGGSLKLRNKNNYKIVPTPLKQAVTSESLNETTENSTTTTTTRRSNNANCSIRTTVTAICNDNTEDIEESLQQLIPISCFKSSDTESDIIGGQRPN